MLAQTGNYELKILDKSHYPRVKVCDSGLSPHSLEMLERLDRADVSGRLLCPQRR